MFHNKVNSSQGLVESDFFLHKNVGTLTLEDLVWNLLHDDDNVTWFSTWELVSLTVEVVGLSIWCTFIDLSIDDLLLFNDTLTIALLALVFLIDLFTLSIAIVARSGRLSVITWSKLLHFGNHTTTLAARALFNSALLATFTVATLANTLTVHGDLGLLTIVNFFKSNFEWVFKWLHLFWTLLLAGSSSTTEQIEKVHSTTTTWVAFFKTFLTILVINLSLFIIGKDLVSKVNLLELFSVTTAIWMMLEGEFSESFLNLVFISLLVDSKNFVELAVIDLLWWATWATHTSEVTEWESSASATEEHFVFGLLKL